MVGERAEETGVPVKRGWGGGLDGGEPGKRNMASHGGSAGS